MKLALTAVSFLLPILASASATTVAVPLIKHKDSAARGTKGCFYESDFRLGSSDSLSPFQVYARDEDGILRLVMSPLRQDDSGFYTRLAGYEQVPAGATCPAHVDLLVIR